MLCRSSGIQLRAASKSKEFHSVGNGSIGYLHKTQCCRFRNCARVLESQQKMYKRNKNAHFQTMWEELRVVIRVHPIQVFHSSATTDSHLVTSLSSNCSSLLTHFNIKLTIRRST